MYYVAHDNFPSHFIGLYDLCGSVEKQIQQAFGRTAAHVVVVGQSHSPDLTPHGTLDMGIRQNGMDYGIMGSPLTSRAVRYSIKTRMAG